MEKSLKLKQETVDQLIPICQTIFETSSLSSEISGMIRNNRSGESGAIKEKYEDFFRKHKDARRQVVDHLSLANAYCAIFESDISALAVLRTNIAKKAPIRPVDKKYSKLRIYYQVTHSKGRPLYPNFGIALMCSLMFNSRTFKFEIARIEKGRDKAVSCEINFKDLTIISESRNYLSFEQKELKFSSLEKLTEVTNICEAVTGLMNAELEKIGLEKLTPTTKLS